MKQFLFLTSLLLLSFVTQAQCDIGGTVVEIPELPYESTGRSTCGAGNNLTSSNTISCTNPAGEEEVFIFTPTITQLYHIEMNAFGSSGQARMILYKGCPLIGQGGECINNATGGNILLAETLEAGETYYLIVTRSINNCFSYNISIDVPLVCPSGLGDAVINIPSLPYVSQNRTTCGAGNNLNNVNTISCSSSAGEEEVFIFTPDITQLYHIEMNAFGSSGQARMILYKGCPLIGQGGECINNATGGNILLAETLEAGETYYLIVTRSINNCFSYNISIDIPLVCPSGLGDAVINIPSLPYVSTGRTTCGAGNNLNNVNTISCSNPAGDEEVFIFTPTITQLYHIESNSNISAQRLMLYKGCPLLGEGGECIANTSGSANLLIPETLEAGETYYLVVSRTNSGCHNYDISIDVPLTCPSGLGDAVINIPSLPYVSTGRTTCGAGNNLNNVNTISCSNPAGDEEVFIFTPTITQLYHIESNSNISAQRLMLYKGCPLLGEGGECIANTSGSANLLIPETLEAGETYYLVVSRTNPGCHNYDISIDVPLTCPSGLGDAVINIPSLPYVSTGRTTCGAGNNLNNVNTISCSNPAGDEEVFIFTPTITQLYHIESNSNISAQRLMLYKGCPLLGEGGECIANTSGSANLLIPETLEAGETYYLVVSRTNPGCHNYDINIDVPLTCPSGLGDAVINIPSLPYVSENRTTCGAGNNLNNANTISCTNPAGEEEVFIFTPTITQLYHIESNSNISSQRLMLYKGCPLLGEGGECIASTSSSNDLLIPQTLEAGETYYLVVSRTNSGCHNYDISIDVPITCPSGLGDAVINIPSLPYVSENRTTCGAGNNLNNANTISCSNPAGEEEVFIFTPTVTQLYHIEMNSNTWQARMILYKGCPLLGQGGECISNATNTNALLAETLEAGETYYLIVTRSSNNCHNYDISINVPLTCPSGLGDAVINIPSLPYVSTGRTTCGAGNNLNDVNTVSCSNSAGEEEVFIFTPTVTQLYHIEMNSNTWQARMILYKGCPLLGQGGECISNATNTNALLAETLEAGETYYLIVTRSSNNCHDYDISIDVPLVCPSGLGDAVINIPSLPYVSTGRTTCGAGNNLNNANTISCGSPSGEEEVFIFMPTISQLYHIEINSNSGGINPARLILFKGCPLIGQGGECISNTSGSSNLLIAETLEAGETYYLIVARTNSGCYNFDISIDVPLVCPSGLGDAVVNIPSLPYQSTGRTTCGAGNNLNNANTVSCGNMNSEEEVFIFTATQTDSVYIEILSSNSNSIATLFKGCPLLGNGGECLGTVSSGTDMILTAFVETGETYYLVVSRSGAGCYSYDIKIEYGSRPFLSYSANPNYDNAAGVYPLQGNPTSLDPNSVYEYRVVYTHPDGLPPLAGYPVVGIDFNGNNQFDEVVSMIEVDPNDNDYLNGKEYYYTRGFEINSNLQYAFLAYDSQQRLAYGQALNTTPGPLVFSDSLDLYLYANDITFDISNPDVNQQVNITAKIRNQYYFTAQNVPVTVYAGANQIASTTINSISANNYSEFTFTTSFNEVGYYPIKVVIDEDETISEGNKLNNFAIRPIIVGDFSLGAGIDVYLDNYEHTTCSGTGFFYSGTAVYTEEFGDSVLVQGAEVIVTVAQTGATYKGYTNVNGRFSVFVAAPSPGTYTLNSTITDFTVEGQADPFTLVSESCSTSGSSGSSCTSCVAFWPPYTPGTPGCSDCAPTTNYIADLAVFSHFISPTSINPALDEEIQIITSLENIGTLPAYDFWVNIKVDGELLGDPIFVPVLYHGFSTSVMATESFSSSVHGFHVIQVELDTANHVPESTVMNNAATRAFIVGDVFDLKFAVPGGLTVSNNMPALNDEIEIDASVVSLGSVDASADLHFYLVTGQDTISIATIPFSIDAMDTLSFSTNWTVTHPQGFLHAEIINVDPVTEASIENNVIFMLLNPGCIGDNAEGIDQIDSCEPITWIDGNTYSTSNNTATFLLEGAAQNGCDSLVTLNFTLWPCTQLQAGSCGATEVAPNQLLFATNVNAPQYRFRFTGDNNGGPGWNNDQFIVDRPHRYVYFNHLVPGFQFGATYSVEVAVGDGNGNFGPYGNACDVTLISPAAAPLTQVQASQCGATVDGNNLIFANQIFDAQGYRFKITGPNNGGAGWNDDVFIVDRPNRNFYFSWLVPGATPGATFSVEVAYLQNDGVTYSPYGAACDITLNPQTTQIQASQCGATDVMPNALVFANQVFDAQGYRFRITGNNDGGAAWNDDVFILDRPNRNFNFQWNVPGSMPGETYEIEVAYLLNDGVTYSAYGAMCEITLFGAAEFLLDEDNDIFIDNKSMVAIEFGANASHNPFTTDFGVQVLNANDQEPIAISIYDMSGKLIERHAINPMDIETARFGANLATGMYLIEVRQSSNQAVIRQVKN